MRGGRTSPANPSALGTRPEHAGHAKANLASAHRTQAGEAPLHTHAHDSPEVHGARCRSVGLVVADHPDRRERENLEVEERRPATQVFEVVVEPRLHVLETRGFAAAAV